MASAASPRADDPKMMEYCDVLLNRIYLISKVLDVEYVQHRVEIKILCKLRYRTVKKYYRFRAVV